MNKLLRVALFAVVFIVVTPIFANAKSLLPGKPVSSDTIRPGEIWPDTDGNHIQAHGGGIIKIKNTYFWYGEQREQGLDTTYRYVSCYSSKDLTHWKFRGNVLKMLPPDTLKSNWILERPKVYYNAKTKKYVMYFHVDDSKYRIAQVGIAVCDKPDGDFTYVKRFRPLGHESRDIGQFIDDDGTAYLVFEDRKFGFRIARLSDDYMDVEKEMTLVKEHMEGGAIVHYDGLYYAIGSALTGWKANPNKYATAPTLEGPWTEFQDIAPVETNTYGSQSTMLIKVVGSKNTVVIFMGDKWNPKNQWNSRYFWMPLEIGDGKLWLPKPQPWKLTIKTGKTSVSSK
ncbi:MAG: family 43 glycosylhydrolase [Bacteroidota bacterium]|nr:family 43 glycosylhydrolase [Bacteroidota bacterium]